MPLITRDQHPASIAVVDATWAFSMRGIAKRVKALLDNPLFTSVVVLRNKRTLSKTFERAAQGDFTSRGEVEFAVVKRTFSNFIDSLFDEDRKNTPALSRRLKENFGPDYAALAKFLGHLGAGILVIRGFDFGAQQAHLDYSSKSDVETDLAAGVTVTMSPGGGGTEIIDAGRDEFKRETENGTLVWGWIKEGSPIAKERVWSVPEGAFAIMKSKGWPGNHLPCLHRAPARKENGNPRERNVGVASLGGKSGI